MVFYHVKLPYKNIIGINLFWWILLMCKRQQITHKLNKFIPYNSNFQIKMLQMLSKNVNP